MKDEDIDCSDCPEMDEEFFKTPKIVVRPEQMETVTLHLGTDVLEWLRKQGEDYQTRINTLLRSYMKAHRG